jgi:PAS domain S-box-containing protein
MLSWIKKFLTSPTFADEDKTRGARILYIVSEIGLVGAVILVLLFVFVTRDFGTRLISSSIAIPLLFFEMALVKKGYVRIAAFFVVVTTWIGGNYTVITTGGVQTVGFGINLIVVLEAGMLISLRAGLVFGAMSSLVGFGMAIAQTQGLIAPVPSEINVFTAWATQSLFLGLMAGLLYTTVNQIQQSLGRAKRVEARLRGIIDNTPDIIMETDRTGIITLINRYQDRYLGKQVRELIHTDDIPNVNGTIDRAFNTGESSSLEVQTCSPDGILTWDSVRVGSIAHEGKVTGLVVIVTDITERKQAEKETQRRLNELATVNVISQVTASQIELDALIQLAGEKLRQVLNVHGVFIALYDPKSNFISFPYWWVRDEVVQVPTFPLGSGLFSSVIRNRQPLVINNDYVHRSVELGVIRPILPQESGKTPKSWLGVPMQVGDQVIGMISAQNYEQEDAFSENDIRLWMTIAANVGMAIKNAQLYEQARQDIAERKLAENALRKSEAFASGLLNNIPAIVYLVGVGKEPLNPTIFVGSFIEKLLGYPSTEFLKDPTFWLKLIHPDDQARVWAESERADQTGESLVSDYRVCSNENKIFWFNDESVLVKDDLGQPLHRLGVCTDITERKRAEEYIQNQLERLNALHNIDNAIKSTNDLDTTLNIFLHEVTTQLKVDAAAVLLFNDDTLTMDYAASRGFHSAVLQYTKLWSGEGYAGRVMVDRKTVHIPDITKTESQLAQVLSLAGESFTAYVSSPLIANGQVVGVLEIFNHSSLATNPEWFDFLDILAGQAAIAIEHAQLLENLQRSNFDLSLAYDATIVGWSRALDLRDKETEGHTQRVTKITVNLALKMGVPETEIIHIRRGALLHDIGKLGIPDNILLKPGKLTPQEGDIMRQHTTFAYDLLFSIHFLRPALDIPYCHHEKWDGTGYPRGLYGEQIPLAARIFAIVDVYDALTSDRPYRKAWSREETFEHIRSLTGTHFDPKVVENFFRVVSEKT